MDVPTTIGIKKSMPWPFVKIGNVPKEIPFSHITNKITWELPPLR